MSRTASERRPPTMDCYQPRYWADDDVPTPEAVEAARLAVKARESLTERRRAARSHFVGSKH